MDHHALTLPGNAAIAVHPDVEYVKVRVGEEHLVLAGAAAGAVLGADTEVVQRWQGRELAGRRYAPLFDFFAAERRAHPAAWTVIAELFVTTTDGTGLVHIAPAFGADDLDAGRRHDLPRLLYVDDAGVLTKEVGAFAGRWFKDADKPITRDLKERGLLFRQTTYKHTYPFNWRGDDPLMYVAREAWYLRTTAIKDRLVELNAQIRWVPDHHPRRTLWRLAREQRRLGARASASGERRCRSGCPIASKDRVEVIGSVAELSEKAGRDLRSLICIGPTSTRSRGLDGEGRHDAPHPRGAGRLVRLRRDAVRAQWHWPFEHRERPSSNSSRFHLRRVGPDAWMVLQPSRDRGAGEERRRLHARASSRASCWPRMGARCRRVLGNIGGSLEGRGDRRRRRAALGS